MLVDFELIKRAQKGDSAAFNEIVLAYRKRIFGDDHPFDRPVRKMSRTSRRKFSCDCIFSARPAQDGGGF